MKTQCVCCEVGTDLQARSHSRKKRLLASSCPSVCLPTCIRAAPIERVSVKLDTGEKGGFKTQVCFIFTGDIDSAIKHCTALGIWTCCWQWRLAQYTRNALLVFHCNKDYTNAQPCYIMHTLPVLLKQTCVFTTEARVPFVARLVWDFVVGEVELGQAIIRVLLLFSGSTIPPLLLARLHLHAALSLLVFIYTLLLPEGQADDSWEPSSTAVLYRQSCSLDRKVPSWTSDA